MASRDCMQRWPPQSLRGFTIVELLVVIVIIGLLMALLLPAVQSIRESARMTQCLSNLRQMGIAAQAYETTRGVLPPGTLMQQLPCGGTNPPCLADQGVGFMPHLLPYLEGQALADRITVNLDPRLTGGTWFNDTSTWQAAQAQVSTFLCPSETTVGTVGARWSGATFKVWDNGNWGRYFRFTSATDQLALGRAHYAANGGRWGQATSARRFWGPFRERSVTRFEEFGDGTSNTILFGESINSVDREEFSCWISVGYVCMASEFNGDDYRSFSCAHPARIGFVFGDGATRTLPLDCDATLRLRLGGMNDGELLEKRF